MKFNIVKLRKIWYAISAILIGGSIAVLSVWGLKQGIDFTGGSILTVRFDQRPSTIEAERTLSSLDLGSMTIQQVGDQDMSFRLKEISEDTHQQIISTLSAAHGNTTELQFSSIGPAIGKELREKSLQGTLVVTLAIMAYIAYAFRKVSAPVQSWKYGVIAIFTAFHVVIVPLGVFSILGHFTGFEIGTSFIAAILTILGYSITDAIVIMDRIRENLQKSSGAFEDIVSLSLRQTFLRSFLTAMASLLTLFSINVFGGDSLKEFTLTLIMGIAVGTYSSLFLAAPLLVTWNAWSQKRAKRA
jgi:preprotein translocase subunit SecF